jgi:hypothetical protein
VNDRLIIFLEYPSDFSSISPAGNQIINKGGQKPEVYAPPCIAKRGEYLYVRLFNFFGNQDDCKNQNRINNNPRFLIIIPSDSQEKNQVAKKSKFSGMLFTKIRHLQIYLGERY